MMTIEIFESLMNDIANNFNVPLKDVINDFANFNNAINEYLKKYPYYTEDEVIALVLEKWTPAYLPDELKEIYNNDN